MRTLKQRGKFYPWTSTYSASTPTPTTPISESNPNAPSPSEPISEWKSSKQTKKGQKFGIKEIIWLMKWSQENLGQSLQVKEVK